MFNYKEKLEKLNKIRHEIKKKRFILDESKQRFGFDEFRQLTNVNNIDEVKGYPFVASKENSKVLNGIKMGIKVVPIETKYSKIEHPSNVEFIVLKELTDNVVNKGISPHIVSYLGVEKVSNKSKALRELNLKKLEVEDKIKNYSLVLLSEYVEGGGLNDWVYNVYNNDKSISDYQWKTIVFQLIYTIFVFQKKYKLMHNDFHYGNILIDNSLKPEGYFVYEIHGTKYYLKNTGVIPKIWDFEFAMTYSNAMEKMYPNKFVMSHCTYDKKTHVSTQIKNSDIETEVNVPINYNEIYDLHYLLTSLLDLYIPECLFDWIMNIYPEELIPEDSSSNESSNSTSSTLSLSSSLESSRLDSSSGSSYSSDSTSTSSSISNSGSTSTSSSSIDLSFTKNTNVYLKEGRIINGMEEEFENLPVPSSILKHEFFNLFKEKPEDFSEETALYFKFD